MGTFASHGARLVGMGIVTERKLRQIRPYLTVGVFAISAVVLS